MALSLRVNANSSDENALEEQQSINRRAFARLSINMLRRPGVRLLSVTQTRSTSRLSPYKTPANP